MGIDVYLRWRGQTDAERKAQFTGYSVTSGHLGYLREAYHGGPYATAYLISENWDEQPDDGFTIPAAELRKRLPATVMASLYREEIIYKNRIDDPAVAKDDADLIAKLKAIAADMKTVQAQDFVPNEHQAAQVSELIAKRKLPQVALAFVDFVELAARKEYETGHPCVVRVSA